MFTVVQLGSQESTRNCAKLAHTVHTKLVLDTKVLSNASQKLNFSNEKNALLSGFIQTQQLHVSVWNSVRSACRREPRTLGALPVASTSATSNGKHTHKWLCVFTTRPAHTYAHIGVRTNTHTHAQSLAHLEGLLNWINNGHFQGMWDTQRED